MVTRLLFVTQTHNVWGGMEQWLHNFTLWLQSNVDWDVRVALPRGLRFNNPQAFLAAHPHLRPIVLDVRAGTESARVGAMERAVHSFRPDLLLPIASAAVFPAVARAKQSGVPVRLVVPVRSLHPDLFVNLVDHFDVVDEIVAISRLSHRWLADRLPSDRVRYVRHGVKPPIAEHVASDRLRVGYAGRLDPTIKRALDLIPFARAAGDAVELHVFGNGPAENELRHALPQVVFHGHVSQEALYRDAYPNLDVLVLFSSEEGTPNVIAEVMQHGVVPVVSRFRGEAAEGFVIENETGLTFGVGDTDAAARHVIRLANDRSFLASLAAAGRAQVAGDTDVRMHRDWLAVLEETLRLAPKVPQRVDPIAMAGRLDRVLTPRLADWLRAHLGRGYRHADGWSEWPGTLPASRERVAQVVDDLRELDRPYTSRA